MNSMKTVAELVDDLFRSHRKPNGREYSYTEVAEYLNGVLDPSHLSKLRYGQIKNPSRETLLALCRFFKVPASYFFPELELPEQPIEIPEDPISIALRSSNVSPAVRKKLEELIRALEDER